MENNLVAQPRTNAPIATLALAVLAALAGTGSAHAGSFKTLHQFSSGNDGANPLGDLTMLNGEFFGTTSAGGMGGGVVFEIDPTSGAETVIHRLNGDKDGGTPSAGLLAWKGELYGTALTGGTCGGGSAFAVNPSTGKTTLLHSFACGNGDDGENPDGALIQYKGSLYGTTQDGGGNDEGTIYKIDPTTRDETELFYFQNVGSTGAQPLGRLLEKNGIIYGTTSAGYGTVFGFNIASGNFTIVCNFNENANAPYAGLIFNAGKFYGTTVFGKYDRGSVYTFKLNDKNARLMYAFRDVRRDGQYSVSDLILVNGVLYGTASLGGKSGDGIVFGINVATKKETILHEFTGGKDGANPMAGVVFYDGALYGTTYGGAKGYGTVFEVQP